MTSAMTSDVVIVGTGQPGPNGVKWAKPLRYFSIGFPTPSPSSSTFPITSSWSPASWTNSSLQSIQANEPSMIGAPPISAGGHSTPVNLFAPDTAKFMQTSDWRSESTFTQKLPALAMRGQLVDDLAGASATRGGSRESETKDWQEKPTGMPSSNAVTMV